MSNAGLVLRAQARYVSVVLIATHAYLAFGFLGPPRLYSSASYTYMLAVANAPTWGWGYIIGAAATMLAPHCNRYGSATFHLIAVTPLAAQFVGFVLAQIAGLSTGWGGLGLFVYPIACHWLLVRARFHPEVGRA